MTKNMKWLIGGIVAVVIIAIGGVGYQQYHQKQLEIQHKKELQKEQKKRKIQLATNAGKALVLSLNKTNQDFIDFDYMNQPNIDNIDASIWLAPGSQDNNAFIVKTAYPVIDADKTPLTKTGDVKDKNNVYFEKQVWYDYVTPDSNTVSPMDNAHGKPKTGKLIYESHNYKVDRKNN
ncbi:hypothetical protein D3P96_07800 [Weissella viridescens]|uniref:Uncharacterized protein n=1 Tax=Weissella viridescens TaxID=1629 RepID=A0A3P2RJ33_WEIVI|nr:hypothetical protein [Weissella viridescens]RRG17448.1 hypothetical protein D3P96_07800 [Weissella viridescens]